MPYSIGTPEATYRESTRCRPHWLQVSVDPDPDEPPHYRCRERVNRRNRSFVGALLEDRHFELTGGTEQG